ncbi:hypothetical protein [Arthrobacter sp. NPDC092385]|uniref:hypothetical protein n=1 Tax=Arthrobacter sp. NPDC092385 TaxID=3363943 RepID=UPI00380FA7A4
MTIELPTERAPLDPRVASALDAFTGAPDAGTLDRIAAAITAADAVDAQQGIYRVTVDDETVERIAFTLGRTYNRGDEFDVRDYTKTARKVLDALTGQPAVPSWGDQVGKVR